MGKIFFCDYCGEVTPILYTIILKDGQIIDVCRGCFYNMKIEDLQTESIN
jgi:hypothetical protein